VRNPSTRQTHFDTTKGAAEHQVVQIAQMANSEDASSHLSETGAEREITVLQNDTSKVCLFEAARHQYRCARRAVLRGIQAKQFKTPATNCSTGRFT
jgi:hypothetical protein